MAPILAKAGYVDSEPNSIIVNDSYSECEAIKEITRVLT